MAKHQTTAAEGWYHSSYSGEDRDDGCANELSIYTDPTTSQLDLLLTNVDFAGEGHDNTFALNRDDVIKLRNFLQGWLNQSKE